MRKKTVRFHFLTVFLTFAAGTIAAAPGDDTAAEAGHSQTAPQQHQHQHMRGPKELVLSIADDARVELWKPDLSRQPVEIRQGKVSFKGTGIDNYHAIVAERTEGRLTESAIRYKYGRGKPSGHSSRELTAAHKSTLEIVPDPIPREHFRYHSDQTWDFIVRFQGEPVVNQQVTLETANGGLVEAETDADGRVSLQIPDDFPDVVAGERDKRSAEFTISTMHTEGEQVYRSTLNAAYRVNPHHWQSLNLGILIVGVGMLTGGLIGRAGRGKKNKGEQS